MTNSQMGPKWFYRVLLITQTQMPPGPLTVYRSQHFVFALPSLFTGRSLAPAVHLPTAAKATAPGPLCFDQVEANHWSVEQEAAGMA